MVKNRPENRYQMAMLVLVSSFVGIFAIAAVIIILIFSKNDGNPVQDAKDVLNILLPVVGTWIGTVLAFYFTKENFEAASKSMTELTKHVTSGNRMGSFKATDKMIHASSMVSLKITFNGDDPDTALKLHDALVLIEKTQKTRLPVIDENSNAVRYVVHKSLFDEYINKNRINVDDIGDTAPKLQDFLTNPDVAKVVKESCEYVGEGASLAEAKIKMDSKGRNCQDVIVTKTGRPDEAALGWITNIIISDNTQI